MQGLPVGETGRTLEKCLSEHKAAVNKNNPKNSIAVYAWGTSTKSTEKLPQTNKRKGATGEEGS